MEKSNTDIAGYQIWQFMLLVTLSFFISFLVLNETNIIPNRNYDFLTENIITEKNYIGAQSIQFVHGGGLTHLPINNTLGEGLSLAHIPNLSILANHFNREARPSHLDLKQNSIFYSNTMGLMNLQAIKKDDVLQFDGSDLFWGVRNVEIESLQNGNVLIGSISQIPVEKTIIGMVNLSNTGKMEIQDLSCMAQHFQDESITLEKLQIPHDTPENHLLTSIINRPSWEKPPQIWITTNKLEQTGPASVSTIQTIGTHTYDMGTELNENGQQIVIKAYGKTNVASGTTDIGIRVNQYDTILVGIIDVKYSWSILCNFQRLTNVTGFVSTQVTIVTDPGNVTTTNYLTSVFDDDYTNLNLSVVCSSSVLNTVTCNFSSATIQQPRQIS
jgi:hypothetical protein